jgi:hexokinase
MAAHQEKQYSSYIGFILGTGINSCYVEQNSRITKNPSTGNEGTQIINIEAGFFDKCPKGELDLRMDGKTQNPGAQLLEKMISGAYFGKITTEVILEACAEGLFSEKTSEHLKRTGDWTTADVDRFCHNPWKPDNVLVRACSDGDERDKTLLFHLINTVMDRTALFTAVNMAAIILKSEQGLSPLKPVCMAVDGTTFYRFFDFRYRVEQYLRKALSGDNQRYYEMVKVEEAPLIGAAIAALIN